MDYEQAVAYIHNIYKRGKKDGLKRITELLRRMGNPQDKLRFVHVAGTNGKGSVCVMLYEMLRAAGYRAGMFTSPFIERFNERISIGGAPVDDRALADAVERVAPHVEAMEIKPSEFELVTAVAVDCFVHAGCEIVVWETGLGGLNDATNAVETKLAAVLTPIDYDHMRELGDTLAQIASHKCGILRPGLPVVTCTQPPEAMRVIEEACAANGAPLVPADEAGIEPLFEDCGGQRFALRGVEYSLALPGAHQRQNAALALAAADCLGGLGYPIPPQAAVRGMAAARWPGRFELLSREPILVVDGGHNPQGIRAAAGTAKRVLAGRPLTVVLGVMADKALDEMLPPLREIAARLIATQPDYPRAMEAGALAARLAPLGLPVETVPDVSDAVLRAADCAAAEGGAALCVGSLYMVAQVRRAGRTLRDRQRAALRRQARTFFDGRDARRAEIGARIAAQIAGLPEYKAARTVFAFVGSAREIDTAGLLAQMLADGKRVCLPLCGQNGEMTAREIRSLDQLRPGAFGLLEPPESCPAVPPQEIALGLIPCAVCDRAFHRVGKGGGYYDRYLVQSPMTRMALCPEGLLLDTVPQEPHDQPMDGIVTEAGVYRRG